MGAGTLGGVWLGFGVIDVGEEVVADNVLDDREKYEVDPVLEALVDGIELEGLDGTGVAGGEDRTTWELEPCTLMVIGLELGREFVDAERFVVGTSLERGDGWSVGIGPGCCVGCSA